MLHKILIRDLNTWGNQLPPYSKVRKDIHAQVLKAVEEGVPDIILDDTIEIESIMWRAIQASKILERSDNMVCRRS